MTGAAAVDFDPAALLARPWTFLRGVVTLADIPPAGPPEIAFAGRSNVGKSSLINSLLARKGLARTSNTPGRTQELNFFVPEAPLAGTNGAPPMVIVDMPGYGYAAAPKAKVDEWTRLVLGYLRGRPTLKRVFLLVDARHGIKANDAEVLDMLDSAAVSYQVVLTKADKLKAAQLAQVTAATAEAVARRPAAFPHVLVTSAQSNLGMDALRKSAAGAVAM